MRLKLPSSQLDNINLRIKTESLRAYISIVRDGVLLSKEKEEKRIDILSKNVKDDIDYHEIMTKKEIFNLEYINYYEGDFECSQIESISTYSIVTVCYMLLETNLIAFAQIAKDRYLINLKYNDITGGKTEKVQKYLKKCAEIDISKFDSYIILKDLEILRNCIVHNEGKINDHFNLKDREKLIQLPKKYKNFLSINKPFHENEQYIIIKLSFCEFIIEKIESFFDDLIDSMGLNQHCYFGDKAKEQEVTEKANAKKEYINAIKKAKSIYLKRIKTT